MWLCALRKCYNDRIERNPIYLHFCLRVCGLLLSFYLFTPHNCYSYFHCYVRCIVLQRESVGMNAKGPAGSDGLHILWQARMWENCIYYAYEGDFSSSLLAVGQWIFLFFILRTVWILMMNHYVHIGLTQKVNIFFIGFNVRVGRWLYSSKASLYICQMCQ